MMTSAIAAGRPPGLGDESQYHFVSSALPHTFLWWAILAGPILGTGALSRKATSAARSRARSNWQMPVFCLLGFSLLAILSLYFSELPGNGRVQCSWRSATGCLSHGRCPVSIEDGGDSGGAARWRGGWIVNPGAGGGRIGQPAALRVLAARLPGGDKSSFAVVGRPRFSPPPCRCR